MPYNPQGSGGGISKLSELTIDTDKDWQGYGISNIEGVAAGMVAGSVIQKGLAGVLVNLSPGITGRVLTSAGPGALLAWLPGGTYYDRYFPVEFYLTGAVAVTVPDGQRALTAALATDLQYTNNAPTKSPSLALSPAAAVDIPDASRAITAALATVSSTRNLYHTRGATWDCYRYWTGGSWSFNLNVNYLRVGYMSGSEYMAGGGARFYIDDIPNGATINSAYIWVLARVGRAHATVNSVIQVEDADDAAVFVNEADYVARSRVGGGGTAWNAIPQWDQYVWYQSPDIKADIQVVVNRALWAAGQHMVIFWHDEGDNSTHSAETVRESACYDEDPFDAIRLEINWSP